LFPPPPPIPPIPHVPAQPPSNGKILEDIGGRVYSDIAFGVDTSVEELDKIEL
jgi:hypothetical protein